MNISKSAPLRGEINIPGDKSISHRAIMFGAISEGDTKVTGFLKSADCLSTIACFRALGVNIEETPEAIIVHGNGLHGLAAPGTVLDTGNSGTTTRLISGILAGQSFESTLTGDASLSRRPMRRILRPLQQMGANITAGQRDCLPLHIQGSELHAISYASPVASAQVKSCVLLAGLYADGPVSVTEPVKSRDHTERMLQGFGADVSCKERTVTISPNPILHGCEVIVPGDISSAAYFIAAAIIVSGSEVLVKNVGINPTRSGMLKVCAQMGADITLKNERLSGGEPVADLLVRSGPLHGVTVQNPDIPALIDELPVIAVLAAYAEGETIIKDAAELKVKECDRIAVVTENLRRMGADVTPTEDGMIIRGGNKLRGAQIDPHLDHRIAMSFAVAGLGCTGTTTIKDAGCVRISYPNFFQDLLSLQARGGVIL